jgi:hypothetical protein
MVTLRHVAITVAACAAVSLAALADEQKPANPQQGFAPRLNDMMVATQLRHFKLWYAGIVQNWPLAKYELTQIREAVDDTQRLFADRGGSKMSAMMTPATDDLAAAIEAKDGKKFAGGYAKLTAACNACHETAGFGFIKIREPRLSPIETSPFTDESFTGK